MQRWDAVLKSQVELLAHSGSSREAQLTGDADGSRVVRRWWETNAFHWHNFPWLKSRRISPWIIAIPLHIA